MNKPSKLRIDVYIDAINYSKLLQLCGKIGAKTVSVGVNTILNEYFLSKDTEGVAIDRLTKVIQGYETKILNLEHELRLKGGV